LKKAAKIDISRFERDIAWTQEIIPVFNLRTSGGFIDISSTLNPVDAQRRMHRAEVGIANPIPGVPEAPQLRLAL
jgi:hypothetical protein